MEDKIWKIIWDLVSLGLLIYVGAFFLTIIGSCLGL
jgi:hypothetical protein